MVCIYCDGSTQVTNSRLQKRNNVVWRRRSCTKCGQLFTTLEQADLTSSIRILGPSGELTLFNRDVLLLDIYDACKHRPKAVEDAQALTQTIMADIMTNLTQNGTISSKALLRAVVSVLDRFDTVASTIYQAYHK